MAFVYPFNGGLPIIGPYSDVAIAASSIVWKRTKSTSKMIQSFVWFMSYGLLGEPNSQWLEETGNVDKLEQAHDEVRSQLLKSVDENITGFDADVVEECRRVLAIVRDVRTKMPSQGETYISSAAGPDGAVDRAFNNFVPMMVRVHRTKDPVKLAHYIELMNDVLAPHASRFEDLSGHIERSSRTNNDALERIMKLLNNAND